MMPGYRTIMREVVANGSRVQVVWGEGDQTVPYTEANVAECASITETLTLDRVGHDAVYENPTLISEKARAFLAE